MKSNRIYNFSAGPSMLPLEALEKASAEMLNYGGSGMSVMEMSHRSKVYESIIQSAESSLRGIMSIPDNYKVLFLQGGATLQFSMIPVNLMTNSGSADYAVTGYFAKKAYEEAKKFGDARLAASGEENKFSIIPKQNELLLNPSADYFYICSNNTIYGTAWQYVPETGNVPLVADMSSNIMSMPVDVSKYGLIFAGAQKNMGIAGLTVVIIREDLIKDPPQTTPTMLNFKIMSESSSMYNTPPTYAIYVLGLVLDWIKSLGGLSAIEKINREKASYLYDYLDRSSLFMPLASKEDRSLMNVTFKTNNPELDLKFVKEAADNGLLNLKGHRALGGMRASIYNAMPADGVKQLVAFMEQFEKSYK